VFGKTDAASAMATMLSRDPSFDMSKLLAGVKKDAPLVRFGLRLGLGWVGFGLVWFGCGVLWVECALCVCSRFSGAISGKEKRESRTELS